ncbi:MAG: heparinase II/III family protein, partial [Candidatus Helarchaeota archaeon]
DNDNGRLHILGKREVLDMTYLLTYAALYFNDPIYKIEEYGFSPEALWLFGSDANEHWRKLPGRSVEELESRAFPDGGIYVMRHKKDYMVISCGPNGQGGRGGHAHNDKLSFELCRDGKDVIVDPGTYLYTADFEARNNLRSTANHNTVMIDNEEQNRLFNGKVFGMENEAICRCLTWEIGNEKFIFKGSHYGYRKLKNPVIHQRQIEYHKKKRIVKIKDNFIGDGEHNLKWFFILSPDIRGRTKITSNKFMLAENIKLFSPEYGKILKTKSIFLELKKQAPFEKVFFIKFFTSQ